jgi:hypothetical protein
LRIINSDLAALQNGEEEEEEENVQNINVV